MRRPVIFSEHRVREQRCPSCATPLDGATSVGHGHRPNAGDVTVCIYCGAILIFTARGGLRPPTPDERAELAADPTVQRAVKAVAVVHRKFHQ